MAVDIDATLSSSPETEEAADEASTQPPPPIANGNDGAPEEQPAEAIDPDLELTELLGVVDRSRRKRALQGLVIVLALALLVVPGFAAYRRAQGQVPVYEAQLDVLYQIDRVNFGETETIMANAKVVAEQRVLRDEVAEAVGVDPEELIESSSIDLVESDTGASSSALRFRVRSVEQDDALRIVRLWVDGFLEQTAVADPDAAERARIGDTIADLQLRREEAREAIADAEQLKADTDVSILSSQRRAQVTLELDRDIAAAGSRYDEIIRDINTHALLLAQLEPEGAEIAVQPLGEGHVDPEPVSPKPLRSLALGSAVGLTLATTYLFVWSLLRNRGRPAGKHLR